MAGDYSRTPQGSSGSGGLGGSASGSTNGSANFGADQSGASWPGQSSYPPSQYAPQYAPSQYSQQFPEQYAQYDGQRAFAVTAAPQQVVGPQDVQGSAYDARYDAASVSGNAAGSVVGGATADLGGEGAILGRLVIRPLPTEPGGQTREALLDGRDVSIGRSPACNIVLDGDQLVSRRHALLRYNGSQYTIVDLGSSNGTFVNEKEIHGNTPLNDGDLITIGEHEVLFSARSTQGSQGATLVSPAVSPAVSAGVGSGGLSGGQMVEQGGLSDPERSGWSGPVYNSNASSYDSPAYSSPASTHETSPQLAPGSLEAAQLVDISAVPTLIEPQANPPARPEPAWSQQAQMFFAQRPSVEQPAVSPVESEMPYSAVQPQRSAGTPQQLTPQQLTPQQPQQLQQAVPPQPQAGPPTPNGLPPQSPQFYGPPPSGPNAYPQQAEPSYAAQAGGNTYGAPYAGPPSNQPPLQSGGSALAQSQAQSQGQSQPRQGGASSGGLASSSYGAVYQGPNTSGARNTTEYLRAVRAQLDEANQRLTQAEEAESRLAEQRNAALLEVRNRLSAILSEQGGAPANVNPADTSMGSLIALARQTAENPNHVSYMMQLSAHAGEIANALETAQNGAYSSSGPSRGANSGLLVQLDALRARIDQLLS